MRQLTTLLLILFSFTASCQYYKITDVTPIVDSLKHRIDSLQSIINAHDPTVCDTTIINKRDTLIITRKDTTVYTYINCPDQPEPPDTVIIPPVDTVKPIKDKLFGFGTQSKFAYETGTPVTMYVDNLSTGIVQTSENSGSFQWCVTRNFPRVVKFKVGGAIDFTNTTTRHFYISNPYLQIEGQSAPSPVTILSCALYINTHDVLIQHLIIRFGDKPMSNGVYDVDDCLDAFETAYNIVIDHCSFSWSQDELLGLYGRDITVSNCLLYDPLHYSNHADEGGVHNPEAHGFGPLISTTSNMTFVRNFIGWTTNRNPHIVTNNFVVANNFSYSYGLTGMDISGSAGVSSGSVINNLHYPTAGQTDRKAQYFAYLRENVSTASRIYFSGNRSVRSDNGSSQLESIFTYAPATLNTVFASASPVNLSSYDILPTDSVESYLCTYAGAWYWNRDEYDKKAIERFKARQGNFINSPSPLPARAYNVSPTEGLHTRNGNMVSGYNFSTTPVTFSVNGKQITLTTNLTSQATVLSELNRQLPAGVIAVDHPHSLCSHIIIQTVEKGSRATLTISGNASVFGIESKTYYGND